MMMCYMYIIRKQFVYYFEELLIFFNLADKYASSNLQRRLQKHYGDAVVIRTQKGQGTFNIILSSSITIAEAIQAASEMKLEIN